jgi:tetratricopeptide (TPR) repeat protein
MYSMAGSDFLKTAAEALDPNKQYCVLLENYLTGKKDYSRLPYLSVMAKNMKDDSLAIQVAADYLHNYLNVQDEKEIFQKKNFQFIESFFPLLTSKDHFFQFIYRNTEKIDSIINRAGAGKSYVERIIRKEEIDPAVWPVNKPMTAAPSWGKLTVLIQKKYNRWYAEKTVLDAQYDWSVRNKDTGQIIKYRMKQIDDYGMDTVGLGWVFISDFTWNYVFGYCKNKDTLNKAAGLVAMIIKNHPDDAPCFDTYANLLYKAGRKDEAIEWEQKASELEREDAKKKNKQPDMAYSNTLDKMKKGLPTW